nr:MAG TPA: hypothetical protein [Caudoviricetes sp.]
MNKYIKEISKICEFIVVPLLLKSRNFIWFYLT